VPVQLLRELNQEGQRVSLRKRAQALKEDTSRKMLGGYLQNAIPKGRGRGKSPLETFMDQQRFYVDANAPEGHRSLSQKKTRKKKESVEPFLRTSPG